MEVNNPNTPLYAYASNLRLTLKAWPAVAGATIGLCYLTQTVARWFGVELPDQENVDIIRRYAGWNLAFALLVAQVVVVMPVMEEALFRWLMFRLPAGRLAAKCGASVAAAGAALLSSAAFSAAHYIRQPWPDAAFVALFFFGLAQCWLYRRTERLWSPMLNHALFNLTNLVLLFVIPEG